MNEVNWKCPHCQEEFFTGGGLAIHLMGCKKLLEHANAMNTPSPQKQSDGLCPGCGRDNPYYHSLGKCSNCGQNKASQQIVIDGATGAMTVEPIDPKPPEPSAGKWSCGESVLDPLTHKFLCPVIHQLNVWAYGYSESKEQARNRALEIVNAMNKEGGK
jgi:hypothetical protein